MNPGVAERAPDFVSALALLLKDARLRERFSAAPAALLEELGVRSADRPALLALRAEDLEFQARILLKKRFSAVSALVPQTCRRLGEEAWLLFQAHGSGFWPSQDGGAIEDAKQFCEFLVRERRGESLNSSERNRMHFSLSPSRLRLHGVRDRSLPRFFPYGLQILAKLSATHWVDWTLHLG